MQSLQKRLLSWATTMQTNSMKSVAYGLRTDRLIYNISTLCINVDSTPAPIFRREDLDVALCTFTQLPWTPSTRHVLSGSCLFKTLQDLAHCVAAQLQDPGYFPIAFAINMECDNSFFNILRELQATRYHLWTFSDEYERVGELYDKLNKPALYLHLRFS